MEDIDKEFTSRVKPGDILVANKTFWVRLLARARSIAIKASGISCVIASTFARYFLPQRHQYRPAYLECDEAAKEIQNGDEVEVDFDTGLIRDLTTGKSYQAQPFPEFIQNIIRKGGLLSSIQP